VAAREAILARTVQDIQRLRNSSSGFEHRRERAIAQLRNLSSSYGITKVESQLPSRVDDAAQQQLMTAVLLMGGRS